jgi:hypothetical protein
MNVINTDYAQYPDHPLHGIPQEILDAARAVTDAAIISCDISPEESHPIADGVVAAVIRKLMELPIRRTDDEDDHDDDGHYYDEYRVAEIAAGDDYSR